MIPKIIHLCWFSDDEFPATVKVCIDSWKKVLPDFKIKRWNREMALETRIPFVIEAIEKRKWAFAADVIRVYALYNEGGIYMDSDICLRARFDELIHGGAVFFQECHPYFFKPGFVDEQGHRLKEAKGVPGFGIQAAFMIAEKGNLLVKAIFDYYKNRHFILSDGTLEMQIIAPSVFANVAEQFGYRYIDMEQTLLNEVKIYPSSYIAGGFSEISDRSFALHCISHSWGDWRYKVKKITNYILKKIKKIFGKKTYFEIELIRQFTEK